MEAQADEQRDGLVEIERHTLEVDANAHAATLVGQGIGASVTRQADTFPGGAYVVSVLPADVLRARQVLGLADPGEVDHPDEAELRRSVRDLLVPVLVIGGLFVLVPIVAFLISFKLQGG
jgi:hypothetical protein